MSDRRGANPRDYFLILAGAVSALLLAGAIAGAIVGVGAYNVAADVPHTGPVHAFLETLRGRSIAAHAQDVVVPSDLNSPERLAQGAGLYAEMCSGCHLAPGMDPTELSVGLYPQAPKLWRPDRLSAGEQFWTIKHGVKMTAMPAWGRTHSDDLIWDMVAFVRKLPSMSAADYEHAVAAAPADHDEIMSDPDGHSHGPHGEHDH